MGTELELRFPAVLARVAYLPFPGTLNSAPCVVSYWVVIATAPWKGMLLSVTRARERVTTPAVGGPHARTPLEETRWPGMPCELTGCTMKQ